MLTTGSEEQLQQIWTQHYQDEGWQFPTEAFDCVGLLKSMGC